MPISKRDHSRKNVTTQAPEAFDIHKAEDFKSYYCNFAQLTFTAMDISITVSEAASDGKIVGISQKARIFFAPVQAKLVREMLENTIKQYEKRYGQIAIPAEAMLKFEDVDNEGGEGKV